jgi:hypothetical protein
MNIKFNFIIIFFYEIYLLFQIKKTKKKISTYLSKSIFTPKSALIL